MTDPPELRGLTWEHPRGYAALALLEGEDVGSLPRAPLVHWDRQPLEDFEARPLPELAQHYDLLVVDHPGLSQPGAAEWLVPMDELFAGDELANWKRATVGPSFSSYALSTRTYALPIDVAAQVGVRDAGAQLASPANWDEVLQTCQQVRSTLCLGGPHAFLMLAAVCAGQGQPLDLVGPGFDEDVIEEALEIMALLLHEADPVLSFTNPISVLDAMATAGPRYCPLVFGYITYQRSRPGQRALVAFDAPGTLGAVEARPRGRGVSSVLGGAGIAVSRRCADLDVAAGYVRRLMGLGVQRDLYARVGGQSSLVEVWDDHRVNQEYNGFYRCTRRTVENAWVRPKLPYFLEVQKNASSIIRTGLQQRCTTGQIRSRLCSLMDGLRPGSATSSRPQGHI